MKLTEFKQKKYGENFVDLKELKREFTKNEKDKKKYFALKNKPGEERKANYLNKNIIW